MVLVSWAFFMHCNLNYTINSKTDKIEEQKLISWPLSGKQFMPGARDTQDNPASETFDWFPSGALPARGHGLGHRHQSAAF